MSSPQKNILATAVAVLLVALLVALLASRPDTGKHELVVLAAASLTDVLHDIVPDFETQHNCVVRLDLGASGTLARRIDRGAHADIYLSASRNWADFLDQNNALRRNSLQTIAANQLVIAGATLSPNALEITRNTPLPNPLHDQYICVADMRAAPAGRYAREALANLGWFDQLKPRIVETASARGALELIARGEVHAGIVYASDARAVPNVGIFTTIPSDTHSPIRYVAAICTATKTPELARQFLAHLRTPQTRDTLKHHGFLPTPQEP